MATVFACQARLLNTWGGSDYRVIWENPKSFGKEQAIFVNSLFLFN
jgi:hypothetical protein